MRKGGSNLKRTGESQAVWESRLNLAAFDEPARLSERWLSLQPWISYPSALLITAIAIALRLGLDGLGPDIVPFALFYPAVLISAVFGGVGPAIVTLAASGLAVTYFWLPPRNTLLFTPASLANLALFAVTAGSIILVGHVLRLSLQRSAVATAALRKNKAELEELTRDLGARISTAVAEREVALQQLHETLKTETIGQLAGGIAHDFNNLLTPIIGSLDMLSSRSVSPERAQKLAGRALAAAEKARTLVGRLLTFGRRQMLEPRPLSVIALLDGLSDLIQRSIGPSTRLVMDLPESLPAIYVDPNQLELALLNLAVNARDAMPDGGTLTISAQLDAPHHGTETLPRVRISVVDTGAGMEESILRRATEPFFTTKTAGRGTGLGLSMVHGLVAQSGGSLMLSSTPGVGTRAELWFPQTNEPVQPADSTAPYSTPSAQGLRVLLVDDEPLVRAGLADMLRDAGHEIVEVENAREALSLIEDCAAFDLVLTDHLMPGMTGGALAQKLRASHPQLPLVVITGYAGAESDVPDDVVRLHKPIRQAELLQSIDRALTGSGNIIDLNSYKR